MVNNPWKKFIKRIPIKADSQQIYLAWTTPSGLEKWFLKKAIFYSIQNKLRGKDDLVEEGDHYKWLWYGYPDSVFEEKKVLQANGKDFFQFSFSGDCIVSVLIKVELGENVVELTQENIPVDENPKTNLYIGCGEGWTFYLANLKSFLEGGIDLRNRNENISGVINS